MHLLDEIVFDLGQFFDSFALLAEPFTTFTSVRNATKPYLKVKASKGLAA
jgi:hypothetical protein